MGYKLCPKCNLNYIGENETECAACRTASKSKTVRSKGNGAVKKSIPRKNIAFKCNYCDGGKNAERIGFGGVCSDGVIDYNIAKGRTWCSADKCLCKQYHDGKIDRAKLDESAHDGSFVCYESNALIGWRMGAGFVVRGKNKGRTNRLLGVRSGSLCVLTTVYPNRDGRDRYIFGIFIVERSHEGDDDCEGDVEASAYRISFTESQAQRLKFWDFYKNASDKAPYQWGTGLFRYLSDTAAVEILKAAVEVKNGAPDEQAARDMLEHYLVVNNLKDKY